MPGKSVALCTEIIVEEHGASAIHGGWRAQVRTHSRKQRRQRRAEPGTQLAEEEQDPGEWLFDTLRGLGYTLDIADNGHITATNERVAPEPAPRLHRAVS